MFYLLRLQICSSVTQHTAAVKAEGRVTIERGDVIQVLQLPEDDRNLPEGDDLQTAARPPSDMDLCHSSSEAVPPFPVLHQIPPVFYFKIQFARCLPPLTSIV